MGSNTKISLCLLAAVLVIAISLSGCVYIQNVFPPAPTRAPVVTVTPTPLPTPAYTATPAPTPVVKHTSSDVRVMPVMDKGIIAFESYPVTDEDLQYENMTIVLANDGSLDAKNVVVTLKETDGFGGDTLVQQQFNVGDIKRGDRKSCTLVTEKHAKAGSIRITANIEWGENGEFSNPTEFIGFTKSIIWMAKF